MSRIQSIARLLTGPVGAALSAALGIIFALAFAHYADTHSAEATNILAAVVIGVMVFLFFDSIFKSREIEYLKEQLAKHDVEIKRYEQDVKEMVRTHTSEVDAFFAEIHPKLDAFMTHGQASSRGMTAIMRLASKDAILREVGLNRIKSYLSDFSIPSKENYIKFMSEASTLESFIDFWNLMIKMQMENGKERPITIFSTHVNSISLYSTRDADITDKLFDQQSIFVEKGGKVFRLLIGKDMSKASENATEYLFALERMDSRKIHAAYINIQHAPNKTLRELSDDILIALPMKYSIKWIRSSAGILKECCISRERDDFQEQANSWFNLLNYLKDYKYDLDEDTKAYEARFRSARERFMQAFESEGGRVLS